MITDELAAFYGLEDEGPRRNDFVCFLNGMLGFAESGRKAAWTKFCDALAATATLIKDRNSAYASLEEKHLAMLKNVDSMKVQVVELLELNDKLNLSNKEYVARIKTLEAELELVSSKYNAARHAATKAEKELAFDRQRNQAGGQAGRQQGQTSQPMEVDSSPQPSEASTQKDGRQKEPNETPALLASPVAEPSASSSSTEVVARSSGPVDVAQLRRRVASLTVENDRLFKLAQSATEVEKVSAEPLKGRFSAEDFNKERRARAELAGKLESVSKEALHMVRKHTEILEAKSVSFEKERAYFQNKVSDLKKTVASLKEDLKKAAVSTEGAVLVPCPDIFLMQDGMPMNCPVPTRNGYLMQLRDIYRQWLLFPSDNEGTFYSTFVCPITGRNTSLASPEQVDVVLGIAAGLRLNVSTTPLIFQYHHRGAWFRFSYTDQIAITSMCCKLHRTKVTDGMATILVSYDQFNLSIVVNKKIADLQMQAVHNSAQTLLVRLMDMTPNFFQQWTFISHPDQVAGGEEGVPAPAV